MVETLPVELQSILDDIRSQLADLAARVIRLEGRLEARGPVQPVQPLPAVPAPHPPVLTEAKLLAISAAIAAFMGERVHIRQIRLVSSNIWAQQGRLSVQASHQLHHE
jgi:methylmalonyl-CoA carboxyltransferase 12S subunit